MYFKKVKAGCLAACLLISLHTFTQTIDYSSSNLSTNICNVFNVTPPQTVSGYTHYPVSGGAYFDANANALVLQCQAGQTNSTSMGTAYAIAFPFKNGYNYTLSFMASETSTDPASNPRLDLGLLTALPDPNTTDPVDCGAVNQGYWGGLASTLTGGSYISNSSATYNVATFTASGGIKYLTVLATQGSSAFLTNVLLTKIVITERPPTFTLSPAAVTKTCGTALSQTFSVANVYNSGGVTSYLWNLGSASNGWLYNGSAAPQTITTTTPSLALTAGGCTTPGNVTATAYIGTTGYPAGTATVSVSGVASSISGSSQICTTGDYSITSLPCGATVTWSVSPAGTATLSTTTGSTTTLTTSATSGNISLNANLVTSCGSFNLGMLLSVASPPADFGITGTVPCQPGRIVQVSNFTAVPSTHDLIYHWSYTPSGGSNVSIPGTGSTIAKKFGPGSYTIYAWGGNACGETNQASYEFNVLSCASASTARTALPHISPNPASGIVTVSSDEQPEPNGAFTVKPDIREIRIIDKTGRILRRQLFPAGTKSATFNVEGIKPDIYILQTGDGKTFSSQKINIQH